VGTVRPSRLRAARRVMGVGSTGSLPASPADSARAQDFLAIGQSFWTRTSTRTPAASFRSVDTTPARPRSRGDVAALAPRSSSSSWTTDARSLLTTS